MIRRVRHRSLLAPPHPVTPPKAIRGGRPEEVVMASVAKAVCGGDEALSCRAGVWFGAGG